jgi:hypothetical protein
MRAPERAPEQPKRKIFNCIVDDTALIAGAKKSTRDGIRKWVSQDAIRLFVPLHSKSTGAMLTTYPTDMASSSHSAQPPQDRQ